MTGVQTCALPIFLDQASQNRFRAYSDVTQRLVTMWQICSGNFIPHKYKGKMFLVDKESVKDAAKAIRSQAYPIISLNEVSSRGFDEIKRIIAEALESILPEKSGFER